MFAGMLVYPERYVYMYTRYHSSRGGKNRRFLSKVSTNFCAILQALAFYSVSEYPENFAEF